MIIELRERDYVLTAFYDESTQYYNLYWLKVLYIELDDTFIGEMMYEKRYGEHVTAKKQNTIYSYDNFCPNMFKAGHMKSFELFTLDEIAATTQMLKVMCEMFSETLSSINQHFDVLDYHEVDESSYLYGFKSEIERFKETQLDNHIVFNTLMFVFKGRNRMVVDEIINAKVLNEELFDKTTEL